MEARDYEAIDQLLSLVGKVDLFEYFALEIDVADETVEEVLRKRRTWAQGQQSNPKYRHEALWLIKNMTLVRRALLDERPQYLAELRRRAQRRNREKLALFIEGSMLDGELTGAREVAVREQGRLLDLPDAAITEVIAEVRRGREQRGAGNSSEPPPSAPFRDYYELLGAPADAPLSELEEAYRGRYRWARSLSDTNLSSEVYAQLDEAWRILKDPERRDVYDTRRQQYMDQLEVHAAGADREFKGFLPPPPKRRGLEFPQAAAPPEQLPASDAITSGELDASVVVLTQDARVVHAEPPVQKGPPPRAAASLNRGPVHTHMGSGAGTTGETIPPPTATAASSISPTDPGIAAGRSVAPAPPDGMQTVPSGGPFQPSRKGRAPKLEIDGAETHRIRVGDAPVLVRFTVRNTGHGQMAGRVLSDREWVQISPSRLDPLKREQVVEARILPKQMPRRQATSLVTVVADHGERRSITIDAERRNLSTGIILAAVAVIAMLFASLVVGWLL